MARAFFVTIKMVAKKKTVTVMKGSKWILRLINVKLFAIENVKMENVKLFMTGSVNHEEKFDFLFSSKKLITFEDSRIIIMKHSKKLLVRAMKVIFYHLQNFVVSLSKKRQQLTL